MINKNYCILILVLVGIYLIYQIVQSKKSINEGMKVIDKEIASLDTYQTKPNTVEISKLLTIKEPIQISYKANTNHIANLKNSLVHKITHPLRNRLKFNNIKYNLYEMRIIKSERLATLGQYFDLEIHLIHKNNQDIFDNLVLVFPIRKTNNDKDAGLLEYLLKSTADVPEKNNFQVYNGKIQTIDFACFNKFMNDTEICFYKPSDDNKTYLIIQKPILENKSYIDKIIKVL